MMERGTHRKQHGSSEEYRILFIYTPVCASTEIEHRRVVERDHLAVSEKDFPRN